MRKESVLILVLLYAIPSFSQLKSDSWETVKNKGKGTLAIVYYEQPGLIQQVNGEMKGVCVDILGDFVKHVKTKYDKDITLNYASHQKEFSGFLTVVQQSPNVLGVTNTSITAERKKNMKFSPPYMSTPMVLLTHNSVPSVKSMEQLAKTFQHFTGVVITGSTHVKVMEGIKKDHIPSLPMKQVGSSEIVLKDLSNNPKLFSILDFTEFVSVVRKQLPVKRHDIDLGGAEDLGFVMHKQSDWDPVWNEFLTTEYRKSTRYKQIISDNLGAMFLTLVR